MQYSHVRAPPRTPLEQRQFVESFKLTDIARVEAEGLDRKDLAKKTADAFLAQILRTSYFHCDPHPGNLCVNKEGQLVYYDVGMMNELSPAVAAGFKEACFAVFGGGPFISDIQVLPPPPPPPPPSSSSSSHSPRAAAPL